jgi:tRNA A-37 threonylcarbamoyl transferase component Bud32
MDAVLSPHIAWARDAIARRSGREAAITEAVRVHSRSTILYRVTARVDGAERLFYLKQYPPPQAADLEFDEHVAHLKNVGEHFARVSAIARAFGENPALVPYRVVDYDASERLILSEAMSGESLGGIRRGIAWNSSVRSTVVETWRRVGEWLGTLHRHTLPPLQSAERPAELVAYTIERLRKWRETDPARAPQADRAIDAVHALGRALDGRMVELTPCHGDVTAYNIIVGRGVGLIDLDDLRFDLPGKDVSQALLELAQFTRYAGLVPLPALTRQATESFLAGYGQPLPQGPAFWLPHLRNLTVFALTQSRRRKGFSASRISNAAHYANTVREIERSVMSILETGGCGDYFRRA